MERIAKAEIAAKAERNLDEVKAEIIEFFTANKTNTSVIKPVLNLCREHGYNFPNDIDDLTVAKEVLAACK